MEEKRLVTPIMEMIMESLKTTDNFFTIRTHGYSHETCPVLDCIRVRVSQTHLVLLAKQVLKRRSLKVVDRRRTNGRTATDARAMGILKAHLVSPGSDELRITQSRCLASITFYFNYKVCFVSKKYKDPISGATHSIKAGNDRGCAQKEIKHILEQIQDNINFESESHIT